MKKMMMLVLFSMGLSLAQEAGAKTDAEFDAHKAKIEQAIKDRNYEAWKAEHDAWRPDDKVMSEKITKDNFDKFAQMVEARQKGDIATAQKLREELGIQGHNGKGQGKGKGQCDKAGKGQGKGNCGMKNGQGSGQGKGKGAGQGKGCQS